MTTATVGYSVDDPRVTAFLSAWHEAERGEFERWYTRLVYDEYAEKSAHDRKKYIALDRGQRGVNQSGVYLLDKATGDVYSIKGYGRPNRRIGTLEDMTARFRGGS